MAFTYEKLNAIPVRRWLNQGTVMAYVKAGYPALNTHQVADIEALTLLPAFYDDVLTAKKYPAYLTHVSYRSTEPGVVFGYRFTRLSANKVSLDLLRVEVAANPYCCASVEAALDALDRAGAAHGGQALRLLSQSMKRYPMLSKFNQVQLDELNAYAAAMPA